MTDPEGDEDNSVRILIWALVLFYLAFLAIIFLTAYPS